MPNPTHIVLVPDGNRRWARRRGKLSAFGHREGAKALEKLLPVALDLGIPYVTFWGTSLNNILKRSSTEVKFLFALFEHYFVKLAKAKAVHENEVRVEIFGRWAEYFPEPTKKAMRQVIEATKHYNRSHLTFLMAYSGVDEMTSAVRSVAAESAKHPQIDISEATIKEHLWTRDLPPVDLVIRTGGEPHWSQGLMMWDVANSQLYFTKTLWPDFAEKEFRKVIADFSKTERRMGK